MYSHSPSVSTFVLSAGIFQNVSEPTLMPSSGELMTSKHTKAHVEQALPVKSN
jgi:hypothetical protein